MRLPVAEGFFHLEAYNAAFCSSGEKELEYHGKTKLKACFGVFGVTILSIRERKC